MKNVLRLAIGSSLLVGSAMVVAPQEAEGYSTIGGSLGLAQRDFRVFNNFNGSSANNNNTIHPNWPDYDGAELALWKGGAEWGSRAHGDGTGDSSQSTVGSGGANFSFVWNGNASGVGGGNDNIISSLGGSSGGVLAYCETPISNGWRIRFYGDAWNWQDGPNNVGSGQDIQGIGCHELGHALGLGHSSSSSATMYAYAIGTGNANRSIASDDSNGVKFIYGTRSASMPSITNITGNMTLGGNITITGTNFSSTGNTLWLQSNTLNGSNSGGEMVKVNGLASSSGGTVINMTLPTGGWEGGAIHVQSNASGGSSLSESHPFGGNGGGLANDTIAMTISDSTPNPGQLVTLSWTGAPANKSYTIVYSFTDGSPLFTTWNGIVGTGATTSSGIGSYNKLIPSRGAGRTAYVEMQIVDGTDIYNSNTVTVSIN
ncbi:MAG: matrixin family metalloprotease [Planctomycetota bacterium]|nr:matrixin family metalloprotease [Planctomycetota bacterium]